MPYLEIDLDFYSKIISNKRFLPFLRTSQFQRIRAISLMFFEFLNRIPSPIGKLFRWSTLTQRRYRTSERWWRSRISRVNVIGGLWMGASPDDPPNKISWDRKLSNAFPCHASLKDVTDDEKRLFCLRLLTSSYSRNRKIVSWTVCRVFFYDPRF